MQKRIPVELLFWVSGLILLYFTVNSADHASHSSLCPLAWLGLSWCPGCGLGRSISAFLHGDLMASLEYHWFGVAAFFILVARIIQLLRNFLALVVAK